MLIIKSGTLTVSADLGLKDTLLPADIFDVIIQLTINVRIRNVRNRLYP